MLLKYHRLLLFMLSLCISWQLKAQCPIFDIEIPDNSCVNQDIPISNKTTQTAKYEWDFCSGDLSKVPSAEYLITVPGVVTTGITTVYDGSAWFGFVISRNVNKLFRLDYGSSLDNIPSISDLDNLGGVLNGPYDLKIEKEGTIWYGLVTNFYNSTIIRVNFGNSLLNNNPTATTVNITPSNSLNGPKVIDLVNDNGIYKTLISNGFSNDVTLLDFGNSLANNATGINIPVGTPAFGVSLMKDCDKWYGLITSDAVKKINFGASWLGTPTVSTLTANISVSDGTNMYMAYDQGNFIAIIASLSGKLYRFNFGKSLITNSAQVDDLTNLQLLGDIIGLSGTKQRSVQQLFAVNYQSNNIYRIRFPNNCSSSNSSSTDTQPTSVMYSQPGTYQVDVSAINANGEIAFQSQPITIKGVNKPEFSASSLCVGKATQFNSAVNQSGSTFWKWDFGDGSTGIGKTIMHQYAKAGMYNVILLESNMEGCSNSITKSIKITEAPSIDFSYDLLLCPTNTIQFKDLSKGIGSDNISSWLWDFGDGDTSLLQNPQHTFLNSGEYVVTLTLKSIGGCDAAISKNIKVSANTNSFDLQDSVCVGQNLVLTNSIIGSLNTQWDFCTNDLNKTPTVTELLSLSQANIPLGIDVVQEGGNWYGFVTNRGSNDLFRLDFGTILNSTPVVTNLGNPGTALNQPGAIKLIKQENIWYGLVVNDNSSNLVRLKFGPTLASTPSVSNLGTFDVLNRPRGLDIVEDAGRIIAIVTTFADNRIHIINFGNSIANNPTPAQVISTSAITGANGLFNISTIKSCNRWLGVVVAYTSKTIYKIDFGADIFSYPLISNITNGVVYDSPLNVQLAIDQGNYFAFISSESGILHRLSFGDKPTSPTMPTSDNLTNFGTLSNTLAFDLVKNKSTWYFSGIDYNNGRFSQGIFPNFCSSNEATSLEINPANINYTKAGRYFIDLTATDVNGNIQVITKSVVVQNSASPNALFTTDNQCLEQETKFLGPSDPSITSWMWNFGDNTSGLGQNPTHQYQLEGNYKVTLTIESSNGCNNQFIKSIRIYNNHKPAPKFLYSTPACTNMLVQFMDQSVSSENELIKRWRWDFGDGSTSTQQNPSHIYKAAGDYLVTLAVSGISGCDSTLSQKITVLSGAKSSFIAKNVCFGDITQFINTTSTDGIWSWNFGDSASTSNTSNLKDPTHQYARPDLYTVTLVVTTPNGCVSIIQKQVRIGVIPTVDFTNSKSCANSPIDFIITSVSSDTTTAILNWDFGDPISDDNSSTEETPSHTFSNPGTYIVTLSLSTSLGCKTSTSKIIEVKPLANPDFSFTNACATQPVAFANTSISAEGDPINNWTWSFGDNTPDITVKDPVHIFTNAGIYTVTLTINSSKSDCKSVITKQIKVSALPTIDFLVIPSCVDYSVHFIDNSKLQGGEITTWEWSFGGQGSSKLQNPSFDFKRPGNYVATLKISSINGCSVSMSQTVIVDLLPEASFSFSPDYQAPPVEVRFTNDSRRSLRYNWDFGDNTATSTEVSPSHIYQNIGVYPVRLIAFRSTDCSDTLIQFVNVNPLVIDAKVKSIAVDHTSGLYTIIANITNTGTVPLNSLTLSLEAGTVFSLQEKWNGVLNPKESFTYPFKAQLIDRINQDLPYICVNVLKANESSTPISSNNRACSSLLSEFSVLAVFPNPANESITIPCIIPDDDDVLIEVYDTQGNKVLSETKLDIRSGVNELKLNISALSRGLYLIRIYYQGQVHNQRLVK